MTTITSKRISRHGPPSVEDIVKQASSFEYNEQVPLRYWLRSADTIQKEAQIYEAEGNDQQTYLLLYRYAYLVLERLSVHPEARDPKNKQALAAASKLVKGNLAKLELLKPSINKRRVRYLEAEARRKAQGGKEARSRNESVDGAVNSMSLSERRGSEAQDEKQALEAGDNRELAARLAKREIRRRDSARRKVRIAGVSEEEEAQRRTGGSWDDWEKQFARTSQEFDGMAKDVDDVSRRIVEAGRLRDQDPSRRSDSRSAGPAAAKHDTYQYPIVPGKSQFDALQPSLPPKGILKPPQRPAKEDYDFTYPPPVPSKHFDGYSSRPAVPAKISTAPDAAEMPSREDNLTPSLNSARYSFKPTATLENGTALRTVFLPPELRLQFLKAAQPNTARNLETCGILCGTLISNALFISKLVIPEQNSTTDTCETMNEGALFDYVDEHDLMQLGWIHTHPSQTCFMSSRDLHTHAGYQVMMREAIAIVCAPSKSPSWGIFRLTDPPGMQSVLNCTQTGLFHPHAQNNLYTDALKPGHVMELPGLEFEIVDLRPGH